MIQHGWTDKLKALAARRSENLSDRATVAKSGLPGYEAVGRFGLLATAATPRPVVDNLSSDANRALADPDLRSRMHALGADPTGSTPEGFARVIRQSGKWAKLMREAGIKGA